MKAIKKYRALRFEETQNGRTTLASFPIAKEEYGAWRGTILSNAFDTEEEAIAFCYETGKYERWLIIPEITFDNFSND